MAKSFCSGCKYWKKILGLNVSFYYCSKTFKGGWLYSLKDRKEYCNGKYYEKKEV